MRVAVFDAEPPDVDALRAANSQHGHDLVFLEPRLSPATARLAEAAGAVCAFVDDDLSGPCSSSCTPLAGIAATTLDDITGFEHDGPLHAVPSTVA